MFTRTIIITATILVAVVFLAGCGENTTINPRFEAEAPELPSVNTMSPDLTFFRKAEVDQQALETGDFDRAMVGTAAGIKTHFFNAAVRVLFLEVTVYSVLVEPVAAFALAIHSVPQPQPDGSWLWTYIFVEDDIDYGIFLYGKPDGTKVEWRMEVSANAPGMNLDHFVWFEGETYEDDSHGYWQFYEPIGGLAAELIRIDWINYSRTESRLTLLVNKAGDPGEGSSLEFYSSTAMGTVEFYDAENITDGIITWYANGSGSILWPDYNEGLIGCWDTNQDNTDCN